MTIFCSQSAGTFFNSAIHGSIPSDAVEITEQRHRELRDLLASGLRLQWDDAGQPIAQAPMPLSPGEQATIKHQRKAAEISEACGVAITGGFWSGALGETHQYSSQLDDQLNLTGVILSGVDSPYACRDAHGVKAFRLHTFAQLRAVGDDFIVFKLQLLQHANELKQQLEQALLAGDLAALEAVTWDAVQP